MTPEQFLARILATPSLYSSVQYRDGLSRFEIPRDPQDENDIFTQGFLKVFNLAPNEYERLLGEIREIKISLVDQEDLPVLLIGMKTPPIWARPARRR